MANSQTSSKVKLLLIAKAKLSVKYFIKTTLNFGLNFSFYYSTKPELA